MNKNWNKWTEEQETLAKLYLGKQISNKAFLELVGRTKDAAHSHFYYQNNHKKRTRHKTPELLRQKHEYAFGGAAPAPELVEDAKRRANANRSLIGELAGDPAPGYSALDKKRKQNENFA